MEGKGWAVEGICIGFQSGRAIPSSEVEGKKERMNERIRVF